MKKLLLLLISCLTITSYSQTALDNYNLSKNETFIKKTETLMLKAANSIVGETGLSAIVLQKRANLAAKVYYDISAYKRIFASLIAAQGTLTLASSDNDIEFTINAVWNDLAGVSYEDLNH